MDRDKFIWCRRCTEVHHVTAFDKAPTYSFVAGETRESANDDWRAFMDRHADHRLEGLKAAGEKYFPAGNPADPMAVAYLEVTNGRETFLLRQKRNSIGEPLIFELLEAWLASPGTTLDIQENEIKKEMKHHFSWAPAQVPADDKINLFVGLFREVVQGLDPDTVRLSECSHADSNTEYGLISPAVTEKLLTKCNGYFLPAELDAIRRFVETHHDDDDVMSLIVKRRYEVQRQASRSNPFHIASY